MRSGLLALILVAACGGRTAPSDDSGVSPDWGKLPDSSTSDSSASDTTIQIDTGKPDGPASLPDFNPPPPPLDFSVPDVGPTTCAKIATAAAGTSGPKGKADILFVVDDSAGMTGYQLSLNQAMATLESTLGSTADYRVGVITTDLGTPFNLPNCGGCGDDATLQSQPFLSSCLAPLTKYLENKKGVKSYTGSLANAFKCLSSVGTNGCGFEQPLESAAIFLTNPQSFIRSDASLVLVILTNEDDCSAKNPYLYDPGPAATAALGQVSSFRCFQHGITCDINDPKVPGPRKNCKPKTGGLLRGVSAYATLLKGLKPAGRVGLVVIAGPTTPVSVSVAGGQTSLSSSCQTQGFASPGIRLKALVDAFGALGKFHSICSAIGPAMTDVASMVTTL
jgi:hypothetical protein